MPSNPALSTRILLTLRPLVEGMIARYSGVGDHAFFSASDFSWIAGIEAQWREIRTELGGVLRHPDAIPNFQDISVEQWDLTQDDRWKTYFFFLYGTRHAGHCAACPVTGAALAGIPGLTTAFFSILYPHKHLPAHRGPYKGVLRYHLGLIVPEPARCGIKVGGEEAQWHEGGSLIFDDTFEHEAWNASDAIRVVLFVDFRRPLRFPASLLNRIALNFIWRSAFVQGALKRSKAWEVRLEQLYQDAN